MRSSPPSKPPAQADPDEPWVKPGPLAAGPRPLKEASRRRRTRLRRFAYWLMVPLAHALVRLLWRTLRVEVAGGAEHLRRLAEERAPTVLSWWHDQSFLCLYHLQCVGAPGRRYVYLVSPSIDGDPVTRLLERMGGDVVRGSATRSGVRSLRAIYREMQRGGGSPVILPDGPIGPPHACKPGAVMLSQLAAAPIQTVAGAADGCWRLRTWDRFVVPRPFARVALVFGEPWVVPAGADGEELERQTRRMSELLDELGERARAALAR